jgi:hypothetical protein
MRKLVLLGVVVAAFAAFGAGRASATNFCPGGLIVAPVSDNVVVLPGSSCAIVATTVTGNVINIGGGLEILASSVGQNVISLNGTYFVMNGAGPTSVGQNVIVIGTTGTPLTAPFPGPYNAICHSSIGLNLKLVQNKAPFVVGDPITGGCGPSGGNTIGLNLISVANTGTPFSVLISFNVIGLNLICIADTPPASGVPGSNTTISGSKIGECATL